MSERQDRLAESSIAGGSPDRFGFEWQTYSEIRADYEAQFQRWTTHLAHEDWVGKSFLDVGCGMGRNSYWPLRYGALRAVAIDVDPRSVAAAQRTLAEFPAARVELGSAYAIPYRDEFDIVFSIGVIHHLEWPDKALAEMVKATKPGGCVLIWVYGLEKNEWIVRVVSPLRRLVLSRLPIRLLHHLSLYPAALLWCGLKFGIRPTEYLRNLRRFSFRHLRSIVFDQLLPITAHYWPRATVTGMLARVGLTDVRIAQVNEVSWSAIGRKPIIPPREAGDEAMHSAATCSPGTEDTRRT